MTFLKNIQKYGIKYIYGLKKKVYWQQHISGRQRIRIYRPQFYYFYGTYDEMIKFVNNQ